MSNSTRKDVLNGNVYNSRRYETMNMITIRGLFGGGIQWFYTVKGIKLHRPLRLCTVVIAARRISSFALLGLPKCSC